MKSSFNKKNEILQKQEAFCVAVALTLSVIASFFFKTSHAYWLPMTVALIFLRPVRGMILKRAAHRIIGTFAGLIMAYLYLQTLMYSDYRWGYLLPLIFMIMIYLILVTDNYAIAVIVITMFVPITEVVSGSPGYFPERIFVKRFFFTSLGCVTALICEYFIYNTASASQRKIKYNTRNYFKNTGKALELCAECFTGKKRLNSELRTQIKNIIASGQAIDSLYSVLKTEYKEEPQMIEIINLITEKLFKIQNNISKILCIINHSTFNETSRITKEELTDICNTVSGKFKNLTRYYYTENIRSTDNPLIEVIKKAKEANQLSATYFFLEEILEINKHIDEYIFKIRKLIRV